MDRAFALKLEKWAIWLSLIGIIVLLHHLFPVFFLTFVMAYIGNTAVRGLTRRFPRRRLNVAIVWLAYLLIVSGLALLVVPRLLNEARNVARQYITSEAAAEAGGSPIAQEGVIHRESRALLNDFIIGIAGEETFMTFRESDAYTMLLTRIEGTLRAWSDRVTREVTAFANQAVIFAFQFVLSLILSFLLIWDLPATKKRMARFSHGRTADIYAEIAPGLRAFGVMLGRAFEAQSVVAIVNAALSTVVFVLLGLPSTALLATIVFVCSYIPILGMIISTIPAAFLALEVGGVQHVGWLIAGILLIHAVEAYMLNPLIYGRHLRLHPVAVLVILLIAEHLFGLWGLLLGVPIAAFVLKYVIEGVEVAPPSDPVPASE